MSDLIELTPETATQGESYQLVSFDCPNCGKTFTVSEAVFGECRYCDHTVSIYLDPNTE